MRKQSEKAPAPFFNIGASSLLVIFLILCLVTFAILTLTSAKSDADFAEKLAHHKTNYYAACNTAESTLDEIDAVLADAWQLSDTDTSKNSINNDSSQPDCHADTDRSACQGGGLLPHFTVAGSVFR